MSESIDFRSGPNNKKASVCAKIQEILLKKFPKSEYLVTKDNLASGVAFHKRLINEFNGIAFISEDAVVLYRFLTVHYRHDAIGEFMRVKNLPHEENGNCMFIDFVVADADKEKSGLKSLLFDNNVEYYMMSRRGNVIIMGKDELKARADKIEKFLIG